MFGVSGSKRVMLANYRRSMSGGDFSEPGTPSKSLAKSHSLPFPDDNTFGTPESTRRKRPPQSSVRNHHELERILEEDTIAGYAVRKVAEAASKFVKERDYVLISAFETSSLDYANFRILLKRQFFLSFTDEEFEQVCSMFDTNDDKVVDGSEFIVVFTILSNIMKNELRRKQRERKLKDEEAFRRMEAARAAKDEQYLEKAVDYNFSQKDEDSALNKINRAAEKYDRTHHSARSIAVFEKSRLDPVQFRDALKGSFDVVLTPQELGAAIVHYNHGTEGPITCQDFIVSFLRYGYQYRMEHHTKQVLETRESEERARKEQQKKVLRNLESLEDAGVDFDFTEQDEQSMLEKIRTAAGKYDKNHPGAVSLAGFDAKYLTPGAFRLTLLRTFNVELSNQELGALTKMFDRKNNETICSHDFLVHFTRVGYLVRSEKRAAQLEMEREARAKDASDHEKKMFAQWKIDNAHFDPDAFTKVDEENALRKLQREASRYHSEHVSAPDLSVFNGADMNVAEFREMVKRQMNLTFTYPELASLLPLIGSKTNKCCINTADFLNKFKSIGWKERQKRRAVQLKLLAEQQRKLEEDKLLRRERLCRQMNDIVDYDFSQEEMDSAVAKLTQAAYKYDKNHPGSGSLEGFMGRSMEPGVFGKMLHKTFHVKLSGKELGAIISIYDADGNGEIDSAEFLSNFFFMQRQCKEVVRKERFERKKKLENEEMTRLMEKERLKHSRETARLKYTSSHEASLLAKLIVIGKKFAIDNASYLAPLNIFKGPAMNGSAFQSAFFRIFLEKLSLPEIGALMNQLNPKMFEVNVVDGPAFITMLQKLGRMCGDVLLGTISEDTITLESLQIVKEVAPGSSASLARSSSLSPSRSLSRSLTPLPSLSPSKGGTSSRSLFNASPAAEICSTNSGRGVTRGVGPDDGFVFTREGFFDDASSLGGGTVSSYGASQYFDEDESRATASPLDPYMPYMKISSGLMSELSSPFSSSPGSMGLSSPNRFSNSYTSSGSRSPAPQLTPLRAGTSHNSRVDDTDVSVTSELSHSPINSKIRPTSLGPSINTSPSISTTITGGSSSSMVASLLGINPWSEKLEEQRKRNKEKRLKIQPSS